MFQISQKRLQIKIIFWDKTKNKLGIVDFVLIKITFFDQKLNFKQFFLLFFTCLSYQHDLTSEILLMSQRRFSLKNINNKVYLTSEMLLMSHSFKQYAFFFVFTTTFRLQIKIIFGI